MSVEWEATHTGALLHIPLHRGVSVPIRVRAAPDWASDHVNLTFILVKGERDDFAPADWATKIDLWRKKIQPKGRYAFIEFEVATLDDLSARDWIESDRLDLDYLSRAAAKEEPSEG